MTSPAVGLQKVTQQRLRQPILNASTNSSGAKQNKSARGTLALCYPKWYLTLRNLNLMDVVGDQQGHTK